MAAEARVRAAAFQRPYGATGQPLELDALCMLGVPVGSAVLFDGIKVREVTGLALIQPGLRRSPARSRWIAAHLSAPIPSRDARQQKKGKKPQLCSGAESRRLPKSDWNPVTSRLDMKFLQSIREWPTSHSAPCCAESDTPAPRNRRPRWPSPLL